MKKTFYQKKGYAITWIAQDILLLKKEDRIPIISEFQEKYSLSRGTVQNAIVFLKEIGAIEIESRGHLGSFLKSINYDILQQYALSKDIFGTMPLPYSRLYEGFATAIYDVFQKNNVQLNMAYVRGSKNRIDSVENGVYDFAVVSKFAAEQAIKESAAIKVIEDFGPHTYLSRHIMLFAEENLTAVEDGMKVGIDRKSYDQQLLTMSVTKNKDVKFIDMPGHQLIYALNNKQIDLGVWNYDEIREKNYQNLNYQFIPKSKMQEDMSSLVMVCRKDNHMMERVLKNILITNDILEIQNKVLTGQLVPRY